MSLFVFLLPFAVASVVVVIIALILRLRKDIVQVSAVVAANVCSNLSITSELVDKVNKLNSIRNDLFRGDKTMSCLDYLYNQELDADSRKCENAILRCLDGKI